MRENIKLISVLCAVAIIGGCSGEKIQTPKKEEIFLETVETVSGGSLVYLPVQSAKVASFDRTPDWAPEPDSMATVDGDMLTRWSSDYDSEEQWIYFDLGKDCIVNNIIIRWERAYSKDYKILGSIDAENWQELYHELNGQGNAMEASFLPVKCHYIKIQNVQKANKDWGVSIWEVEIYGPSEYNPDAEMTKEAYFQRGEDKEEKKVAEELLEQLSAPVVPITEKVFQKGIVYTSWMADELAMPSSDFTLAYVKELGFDTIAIMVPAYQKEIDSEVIFTNDKPDGDTPTIEALTHAVNSCHKLGLRVMIKPHVDPRTNEARINIIASGKWFDSYEQFILRYAEFSQKNNVEIFSIGTELEGTTFEAWSHRWDQVISKVRETYKGVLTYSANWTEYKEVPFWDKMDYIGIDAYFPLTDKDDPALEELVGAWTAKADEIEEWLKENNLTDKGILLTEIGYPSCDGTNRQPWVAISDKEDQQEQADCLDALFQVLTARLWFKGYYIWQYFPQDRWSPLGYTVKEKKAEEVIKKWLNNNE